MEKHWFSQLSPAGHTCIHTHTHRDTHTQTQTHTPHTHTHMDDRKDKLLIDTYNTVNVFQFLFTCKQTETYRGANIHTNRERESEKERDTPVGGTRTAACG